MQQTTTTKASAATTAQAAYEIGFKDAWNGISRMNPYDFYNQREEFSKYAEGFLCGKASTFSPLFNE